MKKNAVDGFIPRRQLPEISTDSGKTSTGDGGLKRRSVAVESSSANSEESKPALTPTNEGGLSRADIDDSLREIDEPDEGKKSKKPRNKRPKSRRRRIIKWAIIAIVVLILAVVGWFAVRALMASNSVFKGDVFGLVQQKALQEDENGRTNILILGTSEDDDGHEAGYLTDSMMILSVNQTEKNAYMISIPRDLYVQYGMACDAGYAGKINAYFNCVNDDWTSESAEDERQSETRAFVGEIFGLDLQYSVHVNYSVMRDVVSALDGITITIESRDPRGVMDSNFDWKCGTTSAERAERCPEGHYISYPNGEVTLDAEHALYLAMARGDVAPTYGLEQSNFDREKNQQKILVAIREKALSTGTLSDFSKVTKLIDAIGANLRTNFETSEVRTLVSLAQSIDAANIQSVSLIDADPAVLTTGTVGGMSSVIPVAGTYEYSDLQEYVKKNIYATAVSREDSHVLVLNASGVSGVAQTEADKLTELGITVDGVDNAPSDQTYSSNKIYRVSDTEKSATEAKLKSLYGASVESADGLSGVTYGEETDYVIIIAEATETN